MASDHRLVIVFEGRDAAGKGGIIKRITQRLNTRVCRVAALPAPNDRKKHNGIFSAMLHICPRPRKLFWSIKAYITAQVLNG